jgi:acyl-CoA dehydrogenase
VHKVTVARRILRNYDARAVPTEHVPTRRAEAEKKFAHLLDTTAINS